MKRAFTLIELVVVIAIIGALSTLIFPVYQHVVQSSRSAGCLSNLRQLGMALNLYLGEHNMVMPTLAAGRQSKSDDLAVIDNTLDAYASEPAVFACPADTHIAADTGTSYYWNVALNGQSVTSLNFLQLTHDQSRIPVLSDKQGFHQKVNILYADGHVTKEVMFKTSP